MWVLIKGSRKQEHVEACLFHTYSDAKQAYDALPECAQSKYDADRENSHVLSLTLPDNHNVYMASW